MDGILSDGRSGKLWTCDRNSGHVLGVVMRVEVDGRFANQLLLFRHTINVGEAHEHKTVMLPEVKTMGYPEGTMHDIECELCEQKRTWWMGEAALERFLERRRRTLRRGSGQEVENAR
jgi:hypothetical protein